MIFKGWPWRMFWRLATKSSELAQRRFLRVRRKLQDFLQAEKTTLGEALRESEVEVRRLIEEL